MKRNKEEMKMAKEICNGWLKYFDNNPEQAYASFIKNTLEFGCNLPSFMDGFSDFVKVSKHNINDTNFICIQRIFDL